MIISVVNHSTVSDEELSQAIRAVNRQIREDFEPHWSLGATLRLEGVSGPQADPANPTDMRGDAILYLLNEANVDGAMGYHDANHHGTPFGMVFTQVSAAAGEAWTTTLSHEALELIADPEVNLLVMGPHPDGSQREVFHWYEMCDAVQAETYKIDDVVVSNFVLPLYFTGGEQLGGRNDFLGRSYQGRRLRSFGVNPGGYVGFYDPTTGNHSTFAQQGDERAQKVLKAKAQSEPARRGGRHKIRGAGRGGGAL